jgi:c-di-GMP-binding flagellar brake protein YcgR
MAEARNATPAAASRYLTDQAEITRVFRIFRDQRAQLALRFDGDATAYTGRVLDVDIGHFLLDDIRPRSGLPLLHRQVPFAATGRTDGLYAYAEVLHVAEADSERGMPYFLVPFPARLLFQQRRRAARFRLPLSVATKGAAVVLTRATGELRGTVIDVSAGGCRAEFDGIVTPPFDVDEAIERCEICIPNLLDLVARGSIRHHAVLDEPPRIGCGIEFVAMDVTDRRRLENFVQRMSEGSAGVAAEII